MLKGYAYLNEINTSTSIPLVEGKKGWPWENIPYEGHLHIPQPAWPRITIVTPSYNQASYIEETIRSVLLQDYPNLEYIIIDGGSTDESVDIIKKYEPWLTYWISEPDRGQSQAILKGFSQGTGELMAWINSDDLYAPGALINLAHTAFSHPHELWFAGRCNILEGNQVKQGWRWNGKGIEEWFFRCVVMQPGVFWRKQLWLEKGGLDENLHYSFDYDLWLRFASVQPFPFWINHPTAYYRAHQSSKTSTHPERFWEEDRIVRERNAQLWQGEPARTRLDRRLKKQKAMEFISEASFNPNLKHRINMIRQAIQMSPLIIVRPRIVSKIAKAFFRLG